MRDLIWPKVIFIYLSYKYYEFNNFSSSFSISPKDCCAVPKSIIFDLSNMLFSNKIFMSFFVDSGVTPAGASSPPGGGGGNGFGGGGGGGGGFLSGTKTLSKGSHTITVGAGGTAGNTSNATSGSNSTAFGLTAYGGGLSGNDAISDGGNGGSGGGAGTLAAGTGLTLKF